jgi:FKBP-type peptidyl-prolyl cis-trans isomerase 2
MALQKKDFIEIDFTGKIKEGGVFDSTKKAELQKSGIQGSPKPFVFSLGQKMFLEAIDDYLIGKDVGKYNIELTPKKAFGKRDPKQIQMIPIKTFYQHQINPIPGASFNFDGKIAKVLTVSGGRVLVDFNNPLAGKEVIYEIEVKRKIEDINEKIKALIDFFFRREIDFKVEDKKVILNVDKGMKQFAEMFKDKFKEILDMEMEAVEKGSSEKKESEKVLSEEKKEEKRVDEEKKDNGKKESENNKKN